MTTLFRQTLARAPFGLFDVHANIGMTDSAALSYGRLTSSEYLALMAACGIERACAFPPYLDDYQAANQLLEQWAATTGGRVLPFARLGGHSPAPLREPWQLRKRVRALVQRPADDATDLGPYCGVKLIPHLSGLPSDVMFARIAERRLPVLVHTGVHSPPHWVVETLLPLVRGPLILAHLGAFPCAANLLHDAVALAQQHEQVYLDTSAAWLASFVAYAAERVPHKLLFGSDAPMVHPLVAWYHVTCAVHDDRVLEAIGHATADELFASATNATSVTQQAGGTP